MLEFSFLGSYHDVHVMDTNLLGQQPLASLNHRGDCLRGVIEFLRIQVVFSSLLNM